MNLGTAGGDRIRGWTPLTIADEPEGPSSAGSAETPMSRSSGYIQRNHPWMHPREADPIGLRQALMFHVEHIPAGMAPVSGCFEGMPVSAGKSVIRQGTATMCRI
jgi:hypothetical protein